MPARKRGCKTRRCVDPTTCERDYSKEELEFGQAMLTYRERYNRPFPTWSEAFQVMQKLGYRRVAPKEEI